MAQPQRIEIPSNLNENNLVNADENVSQPNNQHIGGQAQSRYQQDLQKELISSEKERKQLFKYAFRVTLGIIVVLYIALLVWVFCHDLNAPLTSTVWHIALILALPPTTLLFLLLKVLSNREPTEITKSSPAEELVNQLVGLVKSFLDSKK